MKKTREQREQERQIARRLARKKVKERQKKLLATLEVRLAKQKEATKRWKAANPDKVALQMSRYYTRKAAELAKIRAETPIPPDLSQPIYPTAQTSVNSLEDVAFQSLEQAPRAPEPPIPAQSLEELAAMWADKLKPPPNVVEEVDLKGNL